MEGLMAICKAWLGDTGDKPGDVVKWMTADDAAKMLGVSRNWIYRLVRSGVLKAGKLGRALRFQREQIERDVFGK